jgi:hypothetical protein
MPRKPAFGGLQGENRENRLWRIGRGVEPRLALFSFATFRLSAALSVLAETA